MQYEQAQKYIASLAQRGWRLGLDRMTEFAKRANLAGSLGDGASPKFIHIAGTNGKGSVTAMIQSCLIEQGHKTGAFFSPYVVEPRERVQVGRDMISESELAEIATYLKPIGETLGETEFGGVTEFEFKMAMGFEFWKKKNCEWVALEVGLGGRLDATNIITPTSCAIVSIGLDHVSILGSTLKEIAHEKAGIIKPGKPVVVGQMAEEALTEIERIAAENESQIWRVGREIQWERIRTGVNISTPYSTIQVAPNLFGEIQLHNAAVAYASLEVAGVNRDLEGIRRGFSTATIPGRFERLDYKSKKFILDGAHNADSAAVLAKMLQESKANPKICITGMLTGHTASEFYDQLKEFDLEYYVVPIDFHRSMDPTVLADDLVRLGSKAKVFETLQAAVEAACKDSDADDILVCGSFYLVGETKRQILSQ